MVRKAHAVKIGSNYYPVADLAWGCYADELFFHTSRYYCHTEAFLRNVTGIQELKLNGYRAEKLSEAQRCLMAAILSAPPNHRAVCGVMRIVESVRRGQKGVDRFFVKIYRDRLAVKPDYSYGNRLHAVNKQIVSPNLPPLDPFLSITERSQIPVAVRGHFVEISLKRMVQLIDSPYHQVRGNLQSAILRLHEAGYHLINHPGLTHRVARLINTVH